MNLAFSPGIYVADVTRWGMNTAKTGTPQFWIAFVPRGLVDPAHPGELEACPSFERTVFRAITPNTIDFVIDDLKRLGYDRDTFDDLDPESPNAFNFLDKELRVQCQHEEYQGKTRDKWNFAWGGGFAPKAMESAEVRKLNALFGKKLKEHKAATTNGADPGPEARVPTPKPAKITKREEKEEEIAF